MTQIILTEEQSISTALDTIGIEAIKAELNKTVEFSKKMQITNIDDKKQFEVIKTEKNRYVKTRNSLEKAFKSKRDFYNKEAADNLVAQREVVGVITEEEARLTKIVDEANLRKLRQDNLENLQDRKEALKKCDCEVSDELLLDMKEKDFDNYLTGKRVEYNQKKENELKEREAEVKRQEELEEAKKQAKLEAEKEAKEKAELERQRVEQEKKQAELKHKAELERVKQEQEQKEKAEKQRSEDEKQAKLEADERAKKNEDYVKYTKSIEFDIHQDVDGVRVFYKKVGEYKLK